MFFRNIFLLFDLLITRTTQDLKKNITHEFKTPISTIAISTQVLKDPGIVNSPERLLNYATIIENENHRLKQQVERVLQMARLDKKDITLKKEVTDVHDLIQEAEQNKAFQKFNPIIKLNLHATHSKLKIDKLHIQNVIYNLIDNALKYNQNTPEIDITTKNENGLFILNVTDNGIGIKPEDQKKIFNRFYRVPTGNLHDVKGFGLGLSYVKLIVESHGGKISVSSKLNEGSIFSIQLPISE